ncbi:hypothetical protein J3R30DRAFT_3286341 [Lentinula aciculospora]|uniref:WD40 repeat-like protein n=1 Tax=Lentinula aciculospora TaxID=153920 RepID=A0A9W9AGK3_9AGAR|nr:hypothetical protein J3R30DRAFT_3286341 [Lentinula aciculospora]
MPKDLPGFYFDTERNRYFPLSSRSFSASTPGSSTQQNTFGKRPCIEPETVDTATPHTVHRRNRLSSQTLDSRILNQSRDIHCSRLASTSRFDFCQTASFGDITEFCSATSEDGLTRRYIGDNKGWLYTCSVAEMYMWPPEVNLHSHSQVSSIRVSGQRCVATCFGPVTKVAVQDLHVSGRTTLITLNQVHDVRASHLQNNALILGAKGKAVYIPDIDVSGSVQHLSNRQNSDIFALDRDENLVYTGARNGSITRHDLRVPSDKLSGQWLFQSRFAAAQNSAAPSSVLYLKLVKDCQLLVSQMDGKLCTYDTRFPVQNTPSRIFRGHRNSVTQKLGICIDPMHDFLFAAGEDRRIRGWSLRTGKPFLDDSPATASITTSASSSPYADLNQFRNPFKALFPSPIPTMQITEEGDGSMCLWAGNQQTLYQYFLGQCSKGYCIQNAFLCIT